jgi:predicted dehydrogenase
MNRRQFLKTSAGVAAGAIAAGCTSSNSKYHEPRGAQMPLATSRPVGANGDIRVAVIGFNAQGKQHIKGYRATPGVRLVALCDCDEQVLNTTADTLAKDDIRVTRYGDLRKLLDDREVDVVSMAMPVRWHSLAAIWACQAGKDVYVEKPVSHSIWEGRKLVEAARRHGRVVQAGLNNRSRPELEETFAFIRAGHIGRIVRVRAWDYKRRESIGKVIGPQRIPASVNYDLWTGPAPVLPLMRTRLHYDWHWQWTSGAGEIANNGVHHLDMVRWALAKDFSSSLPRAVISFGGRYGYVDDGQTPNTHVAVYDYEGIPVVYEARGLPRGSASTASTSRPTSQPGMEMDDLIDTTADGRTLRAVNEKRSSAAGGVAIVCEGGYCIDTTVYDNAGKVIRELPRRTVRPQTAFVAAIRSRKIADLRPDILQGHLSTAVCHMANISLQCGESMTFAKAASMPQVRDNAQASAAMERMIAHLQANGVDTKGVDVTMGASLQMDSGTEHFTGDGSERANWFLKDSYRAPFVVPDVA